MRVRELAAAFDKRFAPKPASRVTLALQELEVPKFGETIRRDDAERWAAWLIREVLSELQAVNVCVRGHPQSKVKRAPGCWKCREQDAKRRRRELWKQHQQGKRNER